MLQKKRVPLITIVLIILIILWIAFFSEYSFLRRAKVMAKLKNMEKKIELLQAENDKLENENEHLKNDPKIWEKEARNLGMQKDGDTVFEFQEDK